jgi:hypothetical protein
MTLKPRETDALFELAATVPDAKWRAHGILPASEHVIATQQALRELVTPIARAVLGLRAPVLSATSDLPLSRDG